MSKQTDCKSFLLFLLSVLSTTFCFLAFLSFSLFLSCPLPSTFILLFLIVIFWLFLKIYEKKNYRLRLVSLDPFAQFRKATITFVMSASLSVPVEQLGSY